MQKNDLVLPESLKAKFRGKAGLYAYLTRHLGSYRNFFLAKVLHEEKSDEFILTSGFSPGLLPPSIR